MVKNPAANAYVKRGRFDSWVGKTPRKRAWQPTLVFLPRKPHGQRSLAGSFAVSRVRHHLATKEIERDKVTSPVTGISNCLFHP